MPSEPYSPGGSQYARYSDGRSAGARDATVTLGLAGIEITLEQPYQRILWPYAGLRAGEPVRTHAVDVLLSSAATPGATLFVPGLAFAASLGQRAPHLTAKAERWRHSRPWIVLAAAIGSLLALIYVVGWSPMKSIAGMLPDSWRQRLGDEARASMTEGHKQCSDPAGVAALEHLTARLSKAAEVTKPFKVVVYDWSLLNAFAVPGSQIVMTRELIEKARGPDEVAGVLAHEMGHGIELHPETGIVRAIGLAAAVELMMGGSSGALANMGLILAQLGYTRVAEREADQQGLKTLKNAGISAQGLADFFKRIEEIEGDEGNSKTFKQFDMLRTHPPTAERAEVVRRQGTYPSTPALSDLDWRALKTICNSTIEPETKDRDRKFRDK